jgi:hypothetical protein
VNFRRGHAELFGKIGSVHGTERGLHRPASQLKADEDNTIAAGRDLERFQWLRDNGAIIVSIPHATSVASTAL